MRSRWVSHAQCTANFGQSSGAPIEHSAQLTGEPFRNAGRRALAPVTPPVGCAGLSLYGVHLETKAAKKSKKAVAALRRALLFTHRGYSGPAVLDQSHHAVMALDRCTPVPGPSRSQAAPPLPSGPYGSVF